MSIGERNYRQEKKRIIYLGLFTSSVCLRLVIIQTMREMAPYFTMTKCNKLLITYLAYSTDRNNNTSAIIKNRW